MKPRYYQYDAIGASYDYLRQKNGNPLIVIPTGGGKTPVIGTIADDAVTKWGGRVLVLAHVKELLQQAEKSVKTINPGLDVGVYSAGLKRRDLDKPVICAGIQSVWQKAGELGPFNLILIDEAHLVPPEGEGRYRTFLQNAKIVNPHVRMIGLTATPYRLGSGLIYGPDCLFDDIAYEVGVRELISGGFLSPLVSKEAAECDTSELHVRGGEFIDSEVEDLMLKNVDTACEELLRLTAKRNSTIVFCAGVAHAVEVANRLSRGGRRVEVITGETEDGDRARNIEDFKAGKVAHLVNVGVLTTGFDAPNVDAVALLRSVLSPGLYYQMVGRGFRLSFETGKTDCLILDFGGNVRRHGPVDQIEVVSSSRGKGAGEAMTKVCPNCTTVVTAAYRTCPECDHVFTTEKERHEGSASGDAPLSGEVTTETFPVMEIAYAAHTKKGADDSAPKTLRVDYFYGGGPYDKYSEWVCVEHPAGGFANDKALAWWQRRSTAPMPASAAEAARIANEGALAHCHEITVKRVSGSKFPEIISHDLDEPVSDYEDKGDEWSPPNPEEKEELWNLVRGNERQKSLGFGDPLAYDEVPF